jgi:hypothetical protein
VDGALRAGKRGNLLLARAARRDRIAKGRPILVTMAGYKRSSGVEQSPLAIWRVASARCRLVEGRLCVLTSGMLGRKGASLRPRGTLRAPPPCAAATPLKPRPKQPQNSCILRNGGLASRLHRRGPVPGRGLRSPLRVQASSQGPAPVLYGAGVAGFGSSLGRRRREERGRFAEVRIRGRSFTPGGSEARFAPAGPANPGLNLTRTSVAGAIV